MSIAKISARGTMISSAVTLSKSKILTNISWWRLGIMAPASKTTVLNSSRLNESSLPLAGLILSKARMPFVIPLIAATKGYSKVSSGSRIMELGNATFSGYSAASVFGVTSAKISKTSVKPKVAANSPQ